MGQELRGATTDELQLLATGTPEQIEAKAREVEQWCDDFASGKLVRVASSDDESEEVSLVPTREQIEAALIRPSIEEKSETSHED
jgi:hypothetical protein